MHRHTHRGSTRHTLRMTARTLAGAAMVLLVTVSTAAAARLIAAPPGLPPSPPPAARLSPPVTSLCDPAQQCISASSNEDNLVELLHFGALDTLLQVERSGICPGGRVTATCPFRDSALDTGLAGHAIKILHFTGPGMPCADSSGDAVIMDDCRGSHAAYVEVGHNHGFLSVGASNQEGSVRFLSAGAGMFVRLLPANQFEYWTVG